SRSSSMEDPIQLKEEGNKYFQASDYERAAQSYTQAMKLNKDRALQAVLYRNRAACFLKKEEYAKAASDASRAIDINSSDIKALYRRSQALEKLGKLDQAFKDAQKCATMEPRNKNFQETLRRLGADIQEKLRIQFSTDMRVQKMFEILLDENSEKEKREKAANNLIVLGREEAGAERIFQNNGVSLLLQLIETKNAELVLAAVRTLSGMCTGHKARATAILHYLGIDNICMWMSVDNEEISLAVCNLLQTITDCLLGQGKEEHHGKEEALVLDTKKDLKMITTRLLDMLVSKNVSGQGRDRALNLLNKNIPRKDLKDQDNSRTTFVVDNGLKKILKVVGQIPEMPGCLPLTENTQLTASILLNKLYDDLRCDPERDNYRVICEEYINHRAFLDAKLRPLPEICLICLRSCRILEHGTSCAPTSPAEKWAVEGLAYLTLDADVKDDFVEDEQALQAMFELTSDKTILYSVASALVNCTNSYDTKELVPELVQLAKFSKQHVPEEHPKDKKDFVVKRVKRLLKAGVVSALACMVKADSAILTDQSKELIARVFLALCDDPKDRGTIVAQGGGKALIPLAVEGTDIGKIKASHALAKIAAISNPDIAFPGERVYEVVRPLVSLLNTERDGLQNYEALLGLTNFSGRSDKLRMKIVKERALPDIENYMFENHDQLRQAATECMCNLVVSKEVQERFVADGNDRLKLVVLLCGEDDEKVQKAAAGALAMLTAAQKRLCSKMTEVTTQWLEILQRLCLHDNMEVQHRGLVIAFNLISASKELAKKLVESELLEILTFVGKQEDDPKKQHIINAARDCLTKCMDYGLIKPLSRA
uniref:Protein unc-45 homolog B n=1 Tax=Pavo cristatus TaxID=9049 RepID=A0A8C9F7C9_PAVCR